MMHVDEAVIELAVERGRAVFARTACPPEPVAVDLVIRPVQHGHMRVAQLRQVAGDYVHLGAPAVVERSAGGEQFVPFVIRQVTLHAVVEGDGLVFGGFHFMPGERDYRAVPVLPLDLFDHGRPREHGVLVVAGREAEVLSEESGIFAGQVVGHVGPARAHIGIVMLAGDGGLAGDGVEVGEQGARLRGCMRVDWFRSGLRPTHGSQNG